MKLPWLVCSAAMATLAVACGGDDAGDDEYGSSSESTTSAATTDPTGTTGEATTTAHDSTTLGTTEGSPGEGTTAPGTTSGTQSEATTREDATEGDTEAGPAPCSFEVNHEISPEIFTVGIVTWSTDLQDLDAATIEFGRDTSYGMEAPVDLDEPEFRTLLLGMAPSTDYHFRIVAHAGDETCHSADHTLTTGPAPNGLPAMEATVHREDAVTPGFIVTVNYQSGHALIYDHEGALVWWYEVPFSMLSRAGLSFDGRHMIIRDANPQGIARGESLRVTLDGLEQEEIALPRGHHDFTVTPDDGVVFIVGSDDGCDELVKIDEDGTQSLVYRIADAFSEDAVAREGCHTNSVDYNVEDDTYTFSVRNQNAYVKIGADGELLWVLGGEESDFSGEGASWMWQHGHQMLTPDRILFFNNNGFPDGPNWSLAVEVQLDLAEMTAERISYYDGGEALATPILGDVQRLPSGNTLVTFSSKGTIHEVDPDGELVQSFQGGLGAALGYATHRSTLYGPPYEQP